MKNSLVEHYIKQLEKDAASQENAKKLQTELNRIADLPSLRKLFALYMKPESAYINACCLFNFAPKSNINPLPKTEFKKKLKTWDDELKQIQEVEISVRQKLASFNEFVKDQRILVAFFAQLIDIPQSLMHLSTRSLLNNLNDPKLEKALTYLITLPKTPFPNNPKGSFVALKPLNAAHQLCLTLLYNNTAVYNDQIELSVYSNDLLQTCLRVYTDVMSEMKSKNEKTQNCAFG